MLGYNYCFKKGKFDLKRIEKILKENNIDFQKTGYGIFFKAVDYEQIDKLVHIQDSILIDNN